MGRVADVWAERIAAECAPALMAEIQPLADAVTKPLTSIDFGTITLPLLQRLANMDESQVSEGDMEDGYTTLKELVSPIIEDIVTKLREVRTRIERTLSDHPAMGFHADL